MPPDLIGQPENLLQFLRTRARSASDARLVLDVAFGVAVTAAVLFWRPLGWRTLLGAALTLAAFGAWGMIDRELQERPEAARGAWTLLRVLRAMLAVIGWSAFAAMVLSGVGLALGTWIS